jgi:hypothetical protein
MSNAKLRTDLNNLNTSLHSIISGDALDDNVNIPFVDDEENIDKMNGKSSDSISSNESYPEKVNYNLGRRIPLGMRENNTTGNEASGESDTDDGQFASERRDKPGPLASELQRAAEVSNLGVMRRNSISMPVLNEMDLDALRSLHMKAVESSEFETMDSKESLSKITVSCLRVVKGSEEDMHWDMFVK